MQWHELAALLKNRKWLLLAGMALAMVGAYLVFRTLSPWPFYQATTTVILNPSYPNQGRSTAGASTELVLTYAEWANRRPVLEAVIDTMGLSLSVDKLRSRIEAQGVPGTMLMEISVVDKNPQQAAAITNEIVRQLSNQITDVSVKEDVLFSDVEEELTSLDIEIRAAEQELIRHSDNLLNYRSPLFVDCEKAKLESRVLNTKNELVLLSNELENYQPEALPIGKIEELEDKIDNSEADLEELTANLLGTENSLYANLLQGRISSTQTNLQLWRGELDRLHARRRDDSETEFSRLVRRIGIIQSNIRIWNNELDRISGTEEAIAESEISLTTRQIGVLQSNLGIWQRKYDELKTQYTSLNMSPLVVMEEAWAPPQATNPRVNIIFAGITGLFFTAGLIVLFDRYNT